MYELITPCCPEYFYARLEWNRANDCYPEAIAYCSTEREVKRAVQDARCQNKCIRIRGGGHNYVGTSTGNDTFVIDVSNMNKIEIDSCCNTVTVQGGALLGQIYTFLGSKGYPFPGGSCSTVGISGVVSGGGWGYSSRYLGLACDSLLEAHMVTESGCLLKASLRKNSDLFWAIRGGGGGNFGILTSLTFQLPVRVDKVTYFTITYENPDIETQVQFLDTWQNWIIHAPNEINMKGSISNSSMEGIRIQCTGLFYGTPIQLINIINEFTQIAGAQLTYDYISFLQSFFHITSVYPQYTHFIPYGRFVRSLYPREVLLNLVNLVNEPRPLGSNLVELNVYGLGGRVRDFTSYDSAYYYRDSSYIVLLETFFEENGVLEANQLWMEQKIPYIYSITSGSYINFPYLPLPNYMTDYYGENAAYLRDVKYKFDPDNVFAFPQSIN